MTKIYVNLIIQSGSWEGGQSHFRFAEMEREQQGMAEQQGMVELEQQSMVELPEQ